MAWRRAPATETGWRRWSRRMLMLIFFGLFAAGATYLRILQAGEPVNERTLAVIALFGVTGAVAALVMQLIALIWLRRHGPAARLAMTLVLAPLVFLGALYGCFALFHSAAELEGLFADPGDPHAIVHLAHRMTFVAAGYVVVFAPGYLWPWLYPVLAGVLVVIGLRAR
ncbi:MAG: hypothetical protein ACXIVE_17795 [Salinarimonas sp.]